MIPNLVSSGHISKRPLPFEFIGKGRARGKAHHQKQLLALHSNIYNEVGTLLHIVWLSQPLRCAGIYQETEERVEFPVPGLNCTSC